MDELELFHELKDRHKRHLVYDGDYTFLRAAKELYRPLKNLFNDWRQRIYRFENNLGASVVLYTPLSNEQMTWDLVLARFNGHDPFDFNYADGVTSKLHWRDVQTILDDIKAK